jgi:hypothetical protein
MSNTESFPEIAGSVDEPNRAASDSPPEAAKKPVTAKPAPKPVAAPKVFGAKDHDPDSDLGLPAIFGWDDNRFNTWLRTAQVRAFEAFGRTWGVNDDEPVLNFLYAGTDQRRFEHCLQLVSTECAGHKLSVTHADGSVAELGFDWIPPSWSHAYCLEAQKQVEALVDIDTQAWFKALCFRDQVNTKDVNRFMERVRQISNADLNVPL